MAFDYPSNFSNGTAVENLGTLVQYADYASGGWLAYGFLVIIFVMSFIFSSMISSRKGILAASFITFIFSVYFLRLGIINQIVCFVLIALIIVGALGSKAEGKI